MNNRYTASGPEGAFEPGSGNRVLKNHLGITDPAAMDQLELELLLQLYEELLIDRLPESGIAVDDLKRWHKLWLGNVYPWAGEERGVTLSKDGFGFAAVPQIPRLLGEFERDCLKVWTPCHGLDAEALTHAVAVTHVELILIHPFREGNGRLSRLLADVMTVQSGRNPLDYSTWDARKPEYIAAIHAGLARNYEPMKEFVRAALGA